MTDVTTKCPLCGAPGYDAFVSLICPTRECPNYDERCPKSVPPPAPELDHEYPYPWGYP